MEEIIEYIIPELLVLIPVLYILGYLIKQSEMMNSKYIPLILLVVGIVFALVWECSVKGFCFETVFVGITQGILCTGVAVLGHQLYKQASE